MDVKKGKLNVFVSVIFKLITMIMAIVVKTTLVKICGNEVNGLNSLFISIIGVLSVAELGIGSAITFCMYKPIVDGDNDTVSALYHLFKKLYFIVGGIIFLGGLIVTPFLHFFAKDYNQLNVDMYSTFFLILVSVTISYLFSSKTSLINAYKNNYITTAISQGGVVLQYILQISALYITRSFVAYLICRIIAVAVQWIITEIVTGKKYAQLINTTAKLSSDAKNLVKRNVKAMFMHKIGYVLVNTFDSIIISAFVGVVSLGEYSNYNLILSSMTGVISLVFSSLTSVIGHLYAEEDKGTALKCFERFHFLNFILGAFFFLGYYGVVDGLISVLFSAELVVTRDITFVITVNGFVQFMRRAVLTFRDATGTFYGDRWKPLLEGSVNIVLSITLVKFIGVTGVIIATIVTNLVICHVVEPWVLYKDAFNKSPKSFYRSNYAMIAGFIILLAFLDRLMYSLSNPWLDLLLNGFISVGVFFMLSLVLFIINRSGFKALLNTIKGR